MKMIFGTLIVTMLLVLYVYSVFTGISVVNKCGSTSPCPPETLAIFTSGMTNAMALIGGLVSALVIAELAITKPGEPPVARILDATSSGATRKLIQVVTMVYLLVWVFTGLAAFVVGYMQHDKVLQPLTDLGQSWMGLAIAAGYAYFGVKPQS